MVKQDSMNVFLGCYIPNEMSVHLWDLDSDYYLHNRSFRPPTPYTNRFLHEVNLLKVKTEKSISSSTNISPSGTDGRNAAEEGLRDKIAKRYFIKCGSNRQEDIVCMDTTAAENAPDRYSHGQHQEVSNSSSSLIVDKSRRKSQRQFESDVRTDGAYLGLESGISSRLISSHLICDRPIVTCWLSIPYFSSLLRNDGVYMSVYIFHVRCCDLLLYLALVHLNLYCSDCVTLRCKPAHLKSSDCPSPLNHYIISLLITSIPVIHYLLLHSCRSLWCIRVHQHPRGHREGGAE